MGREAEAVESVRELETSLVENGVAGKPATVLTMPSTGESGHLAGAGGALRCAIFAIEDASRQIGWYLESCNLPREEYLRLYEVLEQERIEATAALKPLWKLAGDKG